MKSKLDCAHRRHCQARTVLCSAIVAVSALACGRIGFVARGDRLGSTTDVDSGAVARAEADAGGSCTPGHGGSATTSGGCSQSSVCGNGMIEPGEECDGGGRCNAQCMLVLPASLVHRYRFNGTGTTVVDSIGGADGTIVGASLSGSGTAALPGGANGPYVDLPNGIISALTDVTVELWLTWRGGAQLQRIFDFGMNTSGEGRSSGDKTSALDALPANSVGHFSAFIDFTAATGDGDETVLKDANAGLDIDVMVEIAVTFQDSTDTFSLYRNGMRIDRSSAVTGHLSSIDDRNVWVGRANQSGVPTLNATIHELRIYNVALSDAELMASALAGPDP